MTRKLNRREFVTSAAVGLAAAAPASAFGLAPAVITQRRVSPVVVASANGHRYTNGGTQTCVETAFDMMTSGTDVLDALIAGVNIVELDPEDASVGYGRRPNADGIVQLDACCMHGPKRRAGGVAALEGVRTPSKVAQMVGEDHHLLGAAARAQSGVHGGRRSQHRPVPTLVARMETTDRPGPLPRPGPQRTERRGASAGGRPRHAG